MKVAYASLAAYAALLTEEKTLRQQVRRVNRAIGFIQKATAALRGTTITTTHTTRPTKTTKAKKHLHWTQTAAGKKRLAKIARKGWRTRRNGA